LDKFIHIRQDPNGEMPAEDLMFACYILGLHNQIEDSLKIWEAKNADFDTYCGLDIQLVPFAGVKETIEFLKEQTSDEGKKAFEYVSNSSKCGDFDDLEDYFSKETMPWFI
jgi:phosphatidate phosphatase APP1